MVVKRRDSALNCSIVKCKNFLFSFIHFENEHKGTKQTIQITKRESIKNVETARDSAKYMSNFDKSVTIIKSIS